MQSNTSHATLIEASFPPQPLSREGEAVLIERTLRGRSDAFGDLIKPYLTHFARFARMRLRNASEAEDAVQGSVLRACRHLHGFRGEASFKSWSSTIEKYRRIIEMRDLGELSVVETEERLSLTAAAVKTRHHRARKLLRRWFVRRERGHHSI